MNATETETDIGQERWDTIVESFRSACILHHEGRGSESRRLIKEQLPAQIRDWMQQLPPVLREEAKADLRDMFTREQSLVEQAYQMQRKVRQNLVQRIIPQVEAEVASRYRSLYIRAMERPTTVEEPDPPAEAWTSAPAYFREGEGFENTFTDSKQPLTLSELSGRAC